MMADADMANTIFSHSFCEGDAIIILITDSHKKSINTFSKISAKSSYFIFTAELVYHSFASLRNICFGINAYMMMHATTGAIRKYFKFLLYEPI